MHHSSEDFLKTFQLHLQAAGLLEQLSLIGLPIVLALVFLPLLSSSLAPSSSWRFHWLTWFG
ncbi:MAG: hypothetical protein RLZZ206_2935 [Cyanobacteriota bacterium]